MSDEQDPFAGGKEMLDTPVSFAKIGDWVKGTFTGFKAINTDNGPTKLYEIKGQRGSYHTSETKNDENGNKVVTVIEPAVEVNPGDFLKIWGGKGKIEDGFKKAKIGQIIAIKFESTTPSKKQGYSPFKNFRFAHFEMDKDYIGETSDDQGTEVADTPFGE